jgi:DMSO/TMAO reductase YedYZ molybdopterin-dependent catalytic subunit
MRTPKSLGFPASPRAALRIARSVGGIRPPLPVFRGRLHDERTATVIGRVLGLAVVVCFVTGVISHYLQQPPGWAANALPSRPVWGYRLTQGLHVATGIAAIPLVAAKLWTVYPRLFACPPVKSVAHALERLSIAVLVASILLEIFIGLLDTLQWYPWPFPFRQTHWALAWVAIGALVLHIAVKAPVIAANWWRTRTDAAPATGAELATGAVAATDAPATSAVPATDAERRSLVTAIGAAVGALTLTTVGQSLGPLKDLDLLAPRQPGHGPQSLPVNRTAAQAGITTARLAGYRLRVAGPRPYELTLRQLLAMPQRSVVLPIACVEGWSRDARWTGVRLRDLLDLAGAPADARIRFVSLERGGGYAVSLMGASYARDPLTLLALAVNGAPLDADHGHPARVIAPNRPGVLQTKWITRIEVLRTGESGEAS